MCSAYSIDIFFGASQGLRKTRSERQQLPPIAVIQKERKVGNIYVPTILTDCKENMFECRTTN
jgi:hypothetical protein